MPSTLPVVSPAFTMCFIIGGKKMLMAMMSETCPPWLTCLAISSHASSICTLLLAADTISSVRRMGTPERMRVLNCLVNRINSVVLTGEKRLKSAGVCRLSEAPRVSMTCVGMKPREARAAEAASTDSASISPFDAAPVSLMAW